MTPITPSVSTPPTRANGHPGPQRRNGERFPLPSGEIGRVAEAVLAAAKSGGASAAETEVSQAVGQSVTVRRGEVETVSVQPRQGYRGHGLSRATTRAREHALTSPLTPCMPRSARRSPSRVTRRTIPPQVWRIRIGSPASFRILISTTRGSWPVEEAVEKGREAEAAALAVDRRLTNTEGATVAWNESEFVYANSNGFLGGYRTTRHHIDCAVIGDPGDGGPMQRDYWYTAGRGVTDLQPASEVGRIAGERTVRRLSARKLGTVECPVLFEAPEAADLIGAFVGAVSGGALYRKSSFLLDSLGTQVFSPQVSMREEPHIPRARGSAPFDNEGVATTPRDVVRDGIVRGYFLGSYSARKLGMVTTGNAGGSHNLVIAHGDDDLAALMRRMGRGLFVTEQLGQGVNPVTGDYSRGAVGFWIEDGAIAFPVEEITIAGNLKEIFRDIVAIGRDVDRRGSRHTGSILIGRMTVAGH